MTRYAIIADIHANWPALEAVLAKVDTLGCDKTICLGDVVGYNAQPVECVAALRERKVQTIQGNHDRYVASGEVPDVVKPVSRRVLDWTREALDDDAIRWLDKLPETHTLDGEYLLVHGSPLDRDEYLLRPPQWKRTLRAMKGDFFGLNPCFFGHTHYPMVITAMQQETKIPEDRLIELPERTIALINPGAVGQPRDRVPKASFCVFDDDAWSVHYHRVDYDIAATQAALSAAGMPPALGARLANGT